jgi:hypothetical protein
MKAPVVEVRLLGIPHYSQGEADGLCLYYAMSMMLAALHPEYQSHIHERPRYKRMGSPVLQALRALVGRQSEFKQRLAHWFLNGMHATEATRLLNVLFDEVERSGSPGAAFVRRAVRTRRTQKFKHTRRQRALRRIWTVKQVFDSLDRHLPIIVAGGWLGNHAALIVGYQRGGANGRWVCLQDPALVHQEWLDCRDVFVDDAEIIVPRQDGFEHRPSRLTKIGSRAVVRHWRPANTSTSLRDLDRGPRGR